MSQTHNYAVSLCRPVCECHTASRFLYTCQKCSSYS